MKHCGKTPSKIEALIILAIGFASKSTHSLMILVGQWSRSQDLFREDNMNFQTASSDVVVSVLKYQPHCQTNTDVPFLINIEGFPMYLRVVMNNDHLLSLIMVMDMFLV